MTYSNTAFSGERQGGVRRQGGECPVGEINEENEDGSVTTTTVTLEDGVCST